MSSSARGLGGLGWVIIGPEEVMRKRFPPGRRFKHEKEKKNKVGLSYIGRAGQLFL